MKFCQDIVQYRCMCNYACEQKGQNLMRTILFVNDDENLLNRLRAIVLDKTVQCFFVSNAEAALGITVF